MLVGESGLFALAMVLAFLLRFEFDIPPEFFRQLLGLLPLAVVSKLVFFLFSGLYRGMWRYTGLSDLWRIGRAVFMAEVALILYVVFSSHFQGIPPFGLRSGPPPGLCLCVRGKSFHPFDL